MAGKSSKKKQDNFEKIKKEMATKKRKAQAKRNQESAKADAENNDLMTPSGMDSPFKEPEKTIDPVTGPIDDAINDFVMTQEEDLVLDKQKDGKEASDNGKIQFVVFRIDDEEFALRITNIKEIIRVPAITKVPNVPAYITGLCNLRGELLPVINSRKLFGLPDKELNEGSRIIVADIHGKKVGLVSDKVSEVIDVEEMAVKEPPASIRGIDGGVIEGILLLNGGKRVIMILEADKIIKAGSIGEDQQRISAEEIMAVDTKTADEEQIVVFQIGTGEYAFNIHYVREIIRLPAIMKVPNAADYIEGMFSLRNQLLAVVNLGKLLGVDYKQQDEFSRVVIIDNGSFSYGVIVDKVSHVIGVKKDSLKESSHNAIGSGTAFVKGIFTLNNGKRLVMLLEPHKLISMEDAAGMAADCKAEAVDSASHPVKDNEADSNLEYVIFRLGEEEYGIEIHHVQEINRISDITCFPGAPACIDGMVDLRGDIIPILNLRKLFSIQESGAIEVSKFLVVEFGSQRIGILIDAVSEVLRVSRSHLEEAPKALKDNDREGYIDKIAKLNGGKRIVLALNLSTLLSFM